MTVLKPVLDVAFSFIEEIHPYCEENNNLKSTNSYRMQALVISLYWKMVCLYSSVVEYEWLIMIATSRSKLRFDSH